MNKITILLLALVASSTFAQETCEDNFLASDSDIDLITGTSVVGSAFEFCETLKAGRSCCTAATVAAFQEKADAILEDLSASVATRDTDMLYLRNAALANTATFTRLQAQIEGASSGVALLISALTSGFGDTADEFTSFTENIQDLIDDFSSYQELRGTCVKYLINLQTSAWCLGCAEPTAFADALTGGALTLSTDKKSAVAAACQPYFAAQGAQSAAISLAYTSQFFATFVTVIDQLTAGGDTTEAIANLQKALLDLSSGTTADSIYKLPVIVPPSCTKTSCPWIFTLLWVNGQLDLQTLALGGIVQGSVVSDEEEETTDDDEEEEETTDDEEEDDEEETDDEEEEEEEEEEAEGAGRRLQDDDGWNPADDESGITVEWNDNPGNVDPSNTSNSAFRTGVIASILALVALLF